MENELLGPRSGTTGTAPPWWVVGAHIKRTFDGQLGIAGFTDQGEPMVLVARGIMGTQRMEADPADWEPDDAKLILTPLQIAKVTYEADRALRMALGISGIPEWMALHENAKLQWMWGVMNDAIMEGEFATSRKALIRAMVIGLRKEMA